MTRDEVVSLAQAYIENHSKPFVWDQNNIPSKRDKSATDWAIDWRQRVESRLIDKIT